MDFILLISEAINFMIVICSTTSRLKIKVQIAIFLKYWLKNQRTDGLRERPVIRLVDTDAGLLD